MGANISYFHQQLASFIEREGFQNKDREWLAVFFAIEDAFGAGEIDQPRRRLEIDKLMQKPTSALLNRAHQIDWHPSIPASVEDFFSLRETLLEQENLYPMARELHRVAAKIGLSIPPLRGRYTTGLLYNNAAGAGGALLVPRLFGRR